MLLRTCIAIVIIYLLDDKFFTNKYDQGTQKNEQRAKKCSKTAASLLVWKDCLPVCMLYAYNAMYSIAYVDVRPGKK